MSPFTPQQLEAIAGRGNLLVAAGAGTGKTRTLVARCLRLVAEERASLENILMVTFTEAAAAEMRARIRKELRELQAARPEDEHLSQQLALLDAANICTMHSFCLQLAREHFHDLSLDPQFSVLDEHQTRPLMRATLDELLERHYSGDGPEARAVQALIRSVGRGSDYRIRKLVIKLHEYSQSLPDPSRWLEEQRRRFEPAEPAEWREWFLEAVAAWRDEWMELIAPFAGEAAAVQLSLDALQELPGKMTADAAAEALRAVEAADTDDANWPRGTKKNVRTPLKNFFADAEFLASLVPDDQGNDPLAQDWDWTREHLMTLMSLTREFTAGFTRAKRELGGVDFADLEQGALRLLADPAIARQWRARLTHVFVDEYQDINEAQDQIITALSRDGAEANRFLVGDVKQSIYRFRLANPKIFGGYDARWTGPDAAGRRIPLTENFRSRAALLEFINPLIAALMRPAVGGVDYEPLEFGATPTRRGALAAKPGDAPCVEFHLIARAEDDGANDDPEDGAPPPVADLLAVEREARLVARRLKKLKESEHPVWDDQEARFRPVRWSDMAVLLRSPSGRAEAFAMEFDRADVPLAAARDGFFESLEVSDLLNLLKLLDNPLQDVPLLAVLRSPLVGLSLDELAEIRAHSQAKPFWTALAVFHRAAAKPLIADKTPGALPANGKAGRSSRGKRVQEPISELPLFSHFHRRDANGTTQASVWEKADVFLNRFARWRELARQASLSHCLELALSETHYEALLLAGQRGVERDANVRRLLDLARQFDPYQRQGLYRFLRFVEAQQDHELDLQPAAPPAADAVRLMSVHKSKGLEFPVVALACLGTRFNEQDLGEHVLLNERYGLCPKITPRDMDQSYPGLTHWLARRSERREIRGEELRMFYVALTRARDALILVGAINRKTANVKWEAEPKQPDLAPELAAPSLPPDDEEAGEKTPDVRVVPIVPSGSRRKDNGPGGEPINTSAVVNAHSPLEWMLAWLPQVTTKESWRDEQTGQNDFLRWQIYDENDPAFADPTAVDETPGVRPSPAAAIPARLTGLEPSGATAGLNVAAPGDGRTPDDSAAIERLKKILAWQYPFTAVTTETAKSSVSALRRRHQDETDADAAPMFRFKSGRRLTRSRDGLSAADVGNAHHAFLQFVALDKVGSAADLKAEAERLRDRGLLTAAEMEALDLNALAAFWQSSPGLKILAMRSWIHREIPFTARFSATDLADSGLALDLPPDEFVVVQGVADLAVILPEEIWIVDFKTDAVDATGVADKTKLYEPQLRLYARALSRIYRRPVTQCSLHFLSARTTAVVRP